MVKRFDLKLVGALTSKPYAFSARSWELESLDFLDFYDSMLSSIRIDVRGLSIMRVLPRLSEKLNEEWISDKIRFAYDAFRRQRLVNPLYKYNNNLFIAISWEESFFIFFFQYHLGNYDYHNSNNGLLALAGNFLDLESLQIYKQFLDSFKYAQSKLLSNHINKFYNSFSEEFLSNNLLSDLNRIDCYVIIGSNLRYNHPIMHIKILRLANQGVPVFTCGVPTSLKIKAYSFGYSLNKFFLFLEGKNKYSLILKKSKYSKIFIGENLSRREDFSISFRLFSLLKSLNLSFSYLYSNPTELGLLALGIVSKEVLMETRILTTSFVYNYNSDNVIFKPDIKFMVYQGHHGDLGAAQANLVYPSTFLIEKKGTFLNLEGNFSKYNFILKPSNNVRTDWRIFKALSLYLGSKFLNEVINYGDLVQLINRYLPSFSHGFFKVSSLFIRDKFFFNIRLENTPLISVYNNYYMADQVSRSSRVMALSFIKFKNYYINFL